MQHDCNESVDDLSSSSVWGYRDEAQGVAPSVPSLLPWSASPAPAWGTGKTGIGFVPHFLRRADAKQFQSRRSSAPLVRVCAGRGSLRASGPSRPWLCDGPLGRRYELLPPALAAAFPRGWAPERTRGVGTCPADRSQ